MFLNSLKIDNYKNLEKFKLNFNKKINCFIGKNGIGKTNIVDSIYHLAFTKSYFNPSTSQNVITGSEYFSISGDFKICLLYTSPSPRDRTRSRMPSSA